MMSLNIYSNQLVNNIITYGKVCTIKESYYRSNEADYANKGEYGDLENLYKQNMFNGIGMSADVFINKNDFNPHYLGIRLNENGLWESKLEDAPNPMIILAHELIHAQRIMYGTAIDTSNGLVKKYNYFDIAKNKQIITYANYEELATVGLVNFGNNPINENSIRAEHSLDIRSVY